jgi:hypothetical protein
MLERMSSATRRSLFEGQRRARRGRRLLRAIPGTLTILFLALALLSSRVLAQAPIFPEQIGEYHKSAPKTMAIPDQELLNEYGLEATESADYATPDKRRFLATAWRLGDSTQAYAWFQSRRPPGAVPSDFSSLAARTSDGVIFAFGNYVFQFTGEQPESEDLQFLYNNLPNFSNAPLPSLMKAMPTEGLVANSERYILGPVSLQRFEPAIPPSVAAFRLGAEAQLAKYNTAKGLVSLLLFSYPTPTMARDQAVEFQKIPKAMVKRTGPMIVVTINPPDPDAAERLMAKVNYLAQVTLNEDTPSGKVRGFAGSILSMLALAGLLIGFCVLAGIAYGGFLIVRRKISKRADPYAMIVLDIDKSN